MLILLGPDVVRTWGLSELGKGPRPTPRERLLAILAAWHQTKTAERPHAKNS